MSERAVANLGRIVKKPAVLALSLCGLVTALAIPAAVSCHVGQSDPSAGLDELRALIVNAAGTPSPSDLLILERKYPRTRTSGLARFLRGYTHHSSKSYQQAVEAFDAQEIGRHSALGDYALDYQAESKFNAGSSEAAMRDYSSLYTQYPDSMMAQPARLRAAEIAITRGAFDRAVEILTQLGEDPDGIFLLARMHEAKGVDQEAVRLYRRLYYERPATSAASQAEGRLTALGYPVKENPGTPDQEISRANGFFSAGQYWEAARAYGEVNRRVPDLERDSEFQLRFGISLVNSKQPAQAILPLTRVGDRNSDLHAQSLFYRAEALRSSNRAAEATVIVDHLLKRYPRSSWSERAIYNLASSLAKQNRLSDALVRYRQLISAYPGSEYAPEASYYLGWQAYRSGNYSEAARILERHLSSYRHPETKFIGEAGFWAARARERLGDKPRALTLYGLVVERYRYGYHGFVAARRAEALRSTNRSLRPEAITEGSDLEQIQRNVLFVGRLDNSSDDSQPAIIAKADDLELIGLPDLSIRELNHAIERKPGSPGLNLRLAQIYAARGDNFQATLVLRRAYPDIYSYKDSDLPREAWEIFFPLRHWNTIKQEAKRYGIDPFLAAGLIRQESVFNPNAISRAGARGLMQVMPATAQLVARQQGTGRISASDLYNPDLNIRLGMDYLAQMLGQLGRVEFAAAAYNAGPGRAKRWVAERGSKDIEEWVEEIPFAETRGYVQGVLRYAANYKRFYRE